MRAAERIVRRVRAELKLSGHAAWRGFVQLLTGSDLTHAASIAYYALLSLFPFLLLVISLLGAVTEDEADRRAVLDFVFRYFPTQLDFVTNQLDGFRARSVQIGVAGLLAMIWGSLGVFGAVTVAVNQAWGVEQQRSFWKHRLVSFLMLVAAGGVLLLALALVSLIQMASASWFGAMLASFQWLTALQTFAVRNLATGLLVIGVGLVFYFVPNAKIRFRDVWVGAVLTGVLWRLAFQGFAWYLTVSAGLRMVHGSVAAVIVFLVWVYVSAIILMYGVNFTATHARLRRKRPDEMPAAPSPRV